MAEETKSTVRDVAAQNTGNPVLDSTVNLLRAGPDHWVKEDFIKKVYECVRELALREPGGLKASNQTIVVAKEQSQPES